MQLPKLLSVCWLVECFVALQKTRLVAVAVRLDDEADAGTDLAEADSASAYEHLATPQHKHHKVHSSASSSHLDAAAVLARLEKTASDHVSRDLSSSGSEGNEKKIIEKAVARAFSEVAGGPPHATTAGAELPQVAALQKGVHGKTMHGGTAPDTHYLFNLHVWLAKLLPHRLAVHQSVVRVQALGAAASLILLLCTILAALCCLSSRRLPSVLKRGPTPSAQEQMKQLRERQRMALGLAPVDEAVFRMRRQRMDTTAQPTGQQEAAAEDDLDMLFLMATDPNNPRLADVFTTLSNADKLKVYGMYRQGLDGDVTGERPGVFSPIERAKYDAWAELQGVSRAEAKRRFIEKVDETVPGWRDFFSKKTESVPNREPVAETPPAKEMSDEQMTVPTEEKLVEQIPSSERLVEQLPLDYDSD